MKSEKEHKYTSTGIKFWFHMEQMESYRANIGNTIISTHISPEGSCNLNCHYCSVKKRTKSHRIKLNVIKDYIEKLISRGLKAVILTGGGEPLLYPYINELVKWLKYDKNLSVALVTNGTMSYKLDDWSVFSWIRVSINDFDGWKTKISIPVEKIPESTVIGCSYIDSGELINIHKDVSDLLDKLNAKYLRILPNCLLDQDNLIKEHDRIDDVLLTINDERFFHQYKMHGSPRATICHQSYFRPYLSEFDGGTVYPCDSLVLNDNVEKFDIKYRLCNAEDILDFLDKKIVSKFSPCTDCHGCVFYENINMLDDWYKLGCTLNNSEMVIDHGEFV